MEVGQDLRSDFVRRELAYDGKGNRPLEFVQCLMRQAATRSGTDTARRYLELIALAGAPPFEDRLRDDHPQGIPDAPNSDLHDGSYNTLSHARQSPANL